MTDPARLDAHCHATESTPDELHEIVATLLVQADIAGPTPSTCPRVVNAFTEHVRDLWPAGEPAATPRRVVHIRWMTCNHVQDEVRAFKDGALPEERQLANHPAIIAAGNDLAIK